VRSGDEHRTVRSGVRRLRFCRDHGGSQHAVMPRYRILVERGFRGRGVAAMALRGAVELIAEAGGGLVEGYAHDIGGVRKKNSSLLYNGTRTMYEREGFTYDRPKGLGNCVMVREVAPSTATETHAPTAFGAYPEAPVACRCVYPVQLRPADSLAPAVKISRRGRSLFAHSRIIAATSPTGATQWRTPA